MNVKKKMCYMVILLMLVQLLSGCGKAKSNEKSVDIAESNEMSTGVAESSDISYSLSQENQDTAISAGQEFLTTGTTAEESKTEIESEKNDYNTEEYSAIEENNFLETKTAPLSTFSADVDTASYANVRRMILSGWEVDPGAVRIEELINYFSYDYEAPANNQPFSVTKEIMDTPWNEDSKLLSIGIKTEDIDFVNKPNSNLVFLLDVSGSMDEENKLPLMVKAFQLLADQMGENDRISIVAYAGFDQILLDGVRGDENKLIVDTLDELNASGSTNGSQGIVTAYELAEKYFIEGGNNRVILATDGDLNVGLTSEAQLKKLIEEKRKTGIFLSVLGFGTGNLKDNKMETLADYGNGNYSYIDSILEAKKVLVEEMGGTLFTVAKDVKFQVEFNPAIVSEYRLIGYENRILQAQDFNDDTKDAGELGAGHCVTALYELKLAGSSDEASNDLKYQDVTFTGSDEWATVNIRYKEPDSDTSELFSQTIGELDYSKDPSENIRFASCVAQFGMLLRESSFSGSATYSTIIEQLNQLSSVAKDEYKSEFKYLVETMSRID